MRVVFLCSAAAAMLTVGAANAGTVTFTGLPDEGAQLTSWVEDGVLTTAQGGVLASIRPDSAHLDDGGTGFARSLSFSTGGRFSAISLGIVPSSSALLLCSDFDENFICTPFSFANVSVTGFVDGLLVASDAFDMNAVAGVYTFSEAFASLDLLVVGFSAQPTDAPDGFFFDCNNGPPCTHFHLDSVKLEPAVVPLPASGGLLAFCVALLAARFRRRF